MSKHVGEKCGKRADGDPDGESDGRRVGRTDGHHHTIIRPVQFSALFFYMLWHIELKLSIWLCFTVLQIKFECRQFPSIFVGVMPLLECRILKIHSFPHFFLTRFDILIWNFAFDFVLLYYRPSLSVVNFRQFL